MTSITCGYFYPQTKKKRNNFFSKREFLTVCYEYYCLESLKEAQWKLEKVGGGMSLFHACMGVIFSETTY